MNGWDKHYMETSKNAGSVWFDDPLPPLTTAEKVEFITIYALAAITSVCAMAALFKWAFQ